MISTEKCCFYNREKLLNWNLCVSQNNYGFSSIKNSRKVRLKNSELFRFLGLTKKSVSIY